MPVPKTTAARVARVVMTAVAHAPPVIVRPHVRHVVHWVAMLLRLTAATNLQKPQELKPRNPPLSASAR
jgi:hypothetical protein